MIEKNLAGIYSDEVFREQNKIIEEKVRTLNIAKSDAVITKYNFEAITAFIKDKFENLATTYENSDLEQKKALLCSIFPSGVAWGQCGYSNTTMSPYYTSILQLEDTKDQFGGTWFRNLEHLY